MISVIRKQHAHEVVADVHSDYPVIATRLSEIQPDINPVSGVSSTRKVPADFEPLRRSGFEDEPNGFGSPIGVDVFSVTAWLILR